MLPFSPCFSFTRSLIHFFFLLVLQRKDLKEISSCLQKRPKTLVWLTEFYLTLHSQNKLHPLTTNLIVKSLVDSKKGTLNSYTSILLKNHIKHQIAVQQIQFIVKTEGKRLAWMGIEGWFWVCRYTAKLYQLQKRLQVILKYKLSLTAFHSRHLFIGQLSSLWG